MRFVWIAALVFFFLITQATAYTLYDNVVAYYSFDDPSNFTTDLTGNYSDGNVSAGVLNTTGILGYGVTFVANTDYIHTNADTNRIFARGGVSGNAQEFSVNAWVIGNATTGTYVKDFSEYFRLSVENNNSITAYYYGGGTTNGVTTPPLIDNDYHMITVTYSGAATNNMSIYLDGVYIGGRADVTMEYNSRDILLSGRPGQTESVVKDGLDEVSFYEYTLPDSDISLLYNSGAGLPYVEFPYYKLYTGYYNYDSNASAVNITRNLTFNLTYNCNQNDTHIMQMYINTTLIDIMTLNCTLNNMTYLVNGTINTEGYHAAYYVHNYTSINNLMSFGNQTYLFDLYDPEIEFYYNVSEGFIIGNVTLGLNCTDSLMTSLTYNISNSTTIKAYQNETNGTLLSISNQSILNGENVYYATCYDLVSKTNANVSFIAYFKNISIIDERENVAFDLTNISSARMYIDDNSTFYDFKSAGTSSINFSTLNDTQLRFEFIEYDGTKVIRYIDVSLINDSEIRICANKDDVTYAPQTIYSAQVRPVRLWNPFSKCYVLADYTRFSYQETFFNIAYTIFAQYRIFVTNETGGWYQLANIDGSVSTTHGIDSLEFLQTSYDFNVLQGALSTQKNDTTGLVNVFYQNLDTDNTASTAVITRMDTGVDVYTYTALNPNQWQFAFNHTILSGVDNETLFKVQVYNNQTSGDPETLRRYFNVGGSSGSMDPRVAMMIAIGLVITALTFGALRFSFGFLGIIVNIIAIAILSQALQTDYIIFTETITVIIIVFQGINFTNKNYTAVA